MFWCINETFLMQFFDKIMFSSPSVLLLNLASGEKLNLKSVNFPRNGISGDSSETQQIDQVFMKIENKMMPMVTIMVIIMTTL